MKDPVRFTAPGSLVGQLAVMVVLAAMLGGIAFIGVVMAKKTTEPTPLHVAVTLGVGALAFMAGVPTCRRDAKGTILDLGPAEVVLDEPRKGVTRVPLASIRSCEVTEETVYDSRDIAMPYHVATIVHAGGRLRFVPRPQDVDALRAALTRLPRSA